MGEAETSDDDIVDEIAGSQLTIWTEKEAMETKEYLEQLYDLCNRVQDKLEGWHHQWPDSAGQDDTLSKKIRELAEQQGPEFVATWELMEYMLAMSMDYHGLTFDWFYPPKEEKD